MPNFYCPPANIQSDVLTFSSAETYHLTHTMRHQVGDDVSVVDGVGFVYQVKLESITKKAVTGRIQSRRRSETEASCRITLAQSLPKARKMDDIIEKGTEIGVTTFVPFISERSVSRPTAADHKVERWQQVALAAMKQSGRAVLPNVEPVITLKELSRQFNQFDAVLIAWEKSALSLLTIELPINGRFLIVIGPEGGFSEGEIGQFAGINVPDRQDIDPNAQANDARPIFVSTISLGPRILRTETAGLIVSALVLAKTGNI